MMENESNLNYLVNSSDFYDPPLFRYAATLIYGSLTVTGLLGNLLVITVVFKVRGMLTTTNCYLVSLAVSDCLFFIATSPREIAALYLPEHVYPFGSFGCPVLSYLPYLAINASSLSITFFTIERYIAICHPMRAKYICTVERARWIIWGIWCFSIIWNCPWLFLAKLQPFDYYLDIPHAHACTYGVERSHWSYRTIYLGDFLFFYVIPVFLYLFLYGRIAKILMRGRMEANDPLLDKFGPPTPKYTSIATKIRKLSDFAPKFTRTSVQSESEFTAGLSRVEEENGHVIQSVDESDLIKVLDQTKKRHDSYKPMNRRNEHLKKGRADSTLSRDSFVSGGAQNRGKVQVIRMLIVIVCVFAICWLPYRAMVVYNSFSSHSWHPDWYLFMAKILLFVNCAINPVLYNVMSKKFRDAFRQLLAVYPSKKKKLTASTRCSTNVHSLKNQSPNVAILRKLPPHKSLITGTLSNSPRSRRSPKRMQQTIRRYSETDPNTRITPIPFNTTPTPSDLLKRNNQCAFLVESTEEIML